MSEFRFRGAFTALVTPFSADASQIDWAAFERLVAVQLDSGISGLVPCGTTGETPTLSDAEQQELIARTVELSAGEIPVLAGTGFNSTSKTIEASLAAAEAGADAVMLVMPYYNKPSQEGLVHHVTLVADAVDLPIVLYNIPSRTGVTLSVESVLRILDRCPRVIGVKDATNNVAHTQTLLSRAGDRVAVMSGDDAITLPLMSVGAKGVVSVTGNVLPEAVAAVVEQVDSGHWHNARRLHLELLEAHAAMFVEPNPAPAKAWLAAQGMMTGAVRAPLVPASEAALAQVTLALEAYLALKEKEAL